MGHGHGHGHGDDRRRLAIALGVTSVVLVTGAVGAAVTGSLALLADLGHLITDMAALLAALVAARLAQRPPSARRTFGLGRAEVLGAAVNALALLVVIGWVLIEALERLSAPREVPGIGMLVFGAVGLLGNIVSLVVLTRGHSANMNVRGAALHVLGDALVLLEGAPAGIDVAEVRARLLAVDGIGDVHDLHVWAINDSNPAVAAHLVIDEAGCATADCGEHGVLDAASSMLREVFGLHHITLQVETAAHADHETACAAPRDVLEDGAPAR